MILNNKNGSSLLEVTVTLIIIVLIGAASLIAFTGSLGSANLSTAASGIENHIRYAQNLATTEGNNHGFRATDSTTYLVFNQTTGNTVTDPQTNQPLQIDLSTKYTGVSFTETTYPAYETIFNGQGIPTAASNITITITNQESSTKTITISATTGRITKN